MNSKIKGLFFLISFAALPSMAAEIFSSNLGKYKIESCEFMEGDTLQPADAYCTDFNEITLAKDEKGILQLKLSKSGGKTESLAIETFDRSQVNTLNTARYEEYGNYHLWTHLQEHHENDESVLEIDRYAFDADAETKVITLVLSKAKFVNGNKEISIAHRYTLSK